MNLRILILSALTLLIFGLGGYLIIENWQLRNFNEVLWHGWDWHWQVISGVICGSLSAGLALLLINSKFFKNERQYYYEMISRLGLSIPGILIISLSAGIGEEIFFRAGLQPIFGIWPTSIIFVLLHGYLNVSNYRIFTYGVLMVIVIAGFGYLYRYTGLYSVMSAHAVFDMILLFKIYSDQKKDSTQSNAYSYTSEEE